MSQPFGGHPRFGHYLKWALSQGCTVNSGYANDDETGEPHTTTKISAPNGRWVIEVGTDQMEFMVPTQVAYLDRRLGLRSPFFSIDPDTGEVKHEGEK